MSGEDPETPDLLAMLSALTAEAVAKGRGAEARRVLQTTMMKFPRSDRDTRRKLGAMIAGLPSAG
jgi:hypothetical protein